MLYYLIVGFLLQRAFTLFAAWRLSNTQETVASWTTRNMNENWSGGWQVMWTLPLDSILPLHADRFIYKSENSNLLSINLKSKIIHPIDSGHFIYLHMYPLIDPTGRFCLFFYSKSFFIVITQLKFIGMTHNAWWPVLLTVQCGYCNHF